jgi:hypothetical protein
LISRFWPVSTEPNCSRSFSLEVENEYRPHIIYRLLSQKDTETDRFCPIIPLLKRFGLCQTISREYILDSKWFGVPNHFVVGIVPGKDGRYPICLYALGCFLPKGDSKQQPTNVHSILKTKR